MSLPGNEASGGEGRLSNREGNCGLMVQVPGTSQPRHGLELSVTRAKDVLRESECVSVQLRKSLIQPGTRLKTISAIWRKEPLGMEGMILCVLKDVSTASVLGQEPRDFPSLLLRDLLHLWAGLWRERL